MLLKFEDAALKGICTVLPKNVRNVESMQGISAKDAHRLVRHTGFSQFHVADGAMTAADYCCVAAQHLLDEMDVQSDTIDALVFVSQTPDYIIPATSTILQERLSLRQDVAVFDINHGCSGFVYGLFQASILIHGGAKRVLLCAGDTISKLASPEDRSTYLLFGDGASASLIERGVQSSAFSFYTDGSRYESLGVRDGGMRHRFSVESLVPHKDENGNCHNNCQIHMDGGDIMNFSLNVVPTLISGMLNDLSVNEEEIELFALHQANKLIIRGIAKKMSVSEEKVPFTAAEIGNTTLASIPLLLSTVYGKQPRSVYDGKRIVLCGFGVGLSAACACILLKDAVIMESIIV